MRGSARALPGRGAAAARCVSRSSGTGHEVNRRRSVHRLSMASSTLRPRARDGATGRQRRAGPAGRAGRGRGGGAPCVAQPSASAATWAWCSAAPQLITRLRPSGSAAVSWRDRSAYSSSACGARRASATAGCCARWEPASASSTIRRRVRCGHPSRGHGCLPVPVAGRASQPGQQGQRGQAPGPDPPAEEHEQHVEGDHGDPADPGGPAADEQQRRRRSPRRPSAAGRRRRARP